MLNKEELDKFWEKRAKHPAPCHYMNPEMDAYAWQTRTSALLELHDLFKGKRVLDVGCGDGTYTNFLSVMVGDKGYVAGLDRHDMVEVHAKINHRVPQFLVGTTDHQDFNRIVALTDIVTLLTVYDFMTIDERFRMRESFKRFAKPGTRVVILDLFPTKVPNYQKNLDYKEVETRDKKIHDMFNAGFDLEEIIPVNYMDTKLFYKLGKTRFTYYLTRMLDKLLAIFSEPKYSLVVFRKL